MMRCFVCLAVLLAPGLTLAAEPQRWALLIGVNDYVDFSDLSFSGNDAAGLADVLRQSGFADRQIVLVTDEAQDARFRPIKANIERQLSNLLGLAGPDDLVIVSFCGHGIHIDGKSYLCPTEANDARPSETMIAVDDVYKMFGECKAALKLLVVDACRNDPRPPGKRSATPAADLKQLGATFERPPDGIVVLASCAPGQISWEDKDLKHVVFIHHVLKGLSGDADGNRNGRVTLGELYDYASLETKLYVLNRFNDVQIPAQRGEINGVFELPRTGPAKEITNSIGMNLKLIPAGEFLMGSPGFDSDAQDDEKPQHRVRITKPFYLGTYEVTRGQFAKFVAAESYRTEAERDEVGGLGYEADGNWTQRPGFSWRNTGFTQTDDHPVVNVSWNDAVAFCEWLSATEGGKKYSLASEAQWEYACRAGTTTRYYHGNDPEDLATIGNVADATSKARFSSWTTAIQASDGYVFTAPVGRFKPNAFGIYDMTGNVWEWCDDWYDESYYAKSRVDDPAGFTNGSERVFRGGGWFRTPAGCRSADRYKDSPVLRNFFMGFRVALVP